MSEPFSLNLLGGFGVYRAKQPLALPPSCQRVVALAALKRRPVHRSWICSTLWPYAPPAKAAASLRSTLWRLRPVGADRVLVIDTHSVALAPGVSVDWHDAVDRIEQLLGGSEPAGADPGLVADLIPLLRAGELLDGWTDRWLALERGSYRAMRMAALDVLTRGSEHGMYGNSRRLGYSVHFKNR